jgi:proton-coupled amino acid transporter
MDYGQVAETTLSEFGPSFIRNRSKLGRKIVNLFVIIAQFGFCCSYFIFIASNIQQFIHDNGSAWFVGEINRRLYINLLLSIKILSEMRFVLRLC